MELKSFLSAALFVVFQTGVVFLYPWAVLFKDWGGSDYLCMGSFVTALAVVFAYCVKKGVLKWEG